MLRQRIITVAVLLPLFLAALYWLPNLSWALVMAAVMGVAGREWAPLAGYHGLGLWLFPLALVASALAILGVEHTGGEFIYSLPGKFVFGLTAAFWIAIVPPWLPSAWRTHDPLRLAIVGWLVLIPFWYALWLQQTPVRLLVALGVVWTADIAAYFAGHAFGRHKMAPTISRQDLGRGLGAVHRRVLKRALKADGIKGYTLDIDATGIKAEKQAAQMTYKGYTGYMPMVGHLAENGLIVGEEFRARATHLRGRGTWRLSSTVSGNCPRASGSRR